MDLRDSITIYTKDCQQLDKKGQAFIYQDPTTQQQLVLKPQDNTNRFDDPFNLLMQEFRKMVLLSAEPEIATVYHLVKVNDNKIGYLMEYIKGQSLQDYLSNTASITYEFAFNVIISVISGIEKAHHYGVTHDDLHEGNIMIDKRGFCKLIDFIDWNVTQFKSDDLGVENDFAFIDEIFKNFLLKFSDKADTRRMLALQRIFLSLRKENSINGLTKILKNLNQSIEIIFIYEPILLRILPIFFKDIPLNNIKSLLMTKKTFMIKMPYDKSLKKEFINIVLIEEIHKLLLTSMNFLQSIGLVAQYNIFTTSPSNDMVEFNMLLAVTPKYFDIYTLVSQYNILDAYRTKEDMMRDIASFSYDLLHDFDNLVKEKPIDSHS